MAEDASETVFKDRGRLLEPSLAPIAAVTIRPSALLRLRDSDERHDGFEGLVEDLRAVKDAVA